MGSTVTSANQRFVDAVRGLRRDAALRRHRAGDDPRRKRTERVAQAESLSVAADSLAPRAAAHGRARPRRSPRPRAVRRDAGTARSPIQRRARLSRRWRRSTAAARQSMLATAMLDSLVHAGATPHEGAGRTRRRVAASVVPRDDRSVGRLLVAVLVLGFSGRALFGVLDLARDRPAARSPNGCRSGAWRRRSARHGAAVRTRRRVSRPRDDVHADGRPAATCRRRHSARGGRDRARCGIVELRRGAGCFVDGTDQQRDGRRRARRGDAAAAHRRIRDRARRRRQFRAYVERRRDALTRAWRVDSLHLAADARGHPASARGARPREARHRRIEGRSEWAGARVRRSRAFHERDPGASPIRRICSL